MGVKITACAAAVKAISRDGVLLRNEIYRLQTRALNSKRKVKLAYWIYSVCTLLEAVQTCTMFSCELSDVVFNLCQQD